MSRRGFAAGTAAVAVGLLSVAAKAAPQERGDLDARIEEIAREALTGDVGGLSIAVAVGPDTFLADGWGYADAGQHRLAGAESPYRVGALLHPFLAVAALRLAERGALELEAPVTAYVPEFPCDERGEERITVADLIGHTSGIPGYEHLPAVTDQLDRAVDPATVLAWLAGQPLESTPGECLGYSNTNTLLLGTILAGVAGRPVPELLDELVFEPAGMEDTEYCGAGPTLRELAHVTHEFAGGIEDEHAAPAPFEAEKLCSTAVDLVRWQRALVDRVLLGDASVRLRATPLELVDGERAPYGYGVNLASLDGFACESIGGGAAGYRVHVAYYPEPELCIAVLANGDEAPVRTIAQKIARAFLLVPEPGIHDRRLPPAERRRYVGEYYVGCTSYAIGDADGRLFLRPPVGPPHVLLYQGQHVFVAADDHAIRLTFELRDRAVVAFVLEEHGVTSRAERLHGSADAPGKRRLR